MILLGLNAWHGDASAALLVDGRLVAAAEEERFTRVKHDAGFPAHAVRWCLAQAGARLRDVDVVAVARDPWARWGRKLAWALRLPRFGADRARAARRGLGLAGDVADALDAPVGDVRRIARVEHHRAHLASAFFASPFDRAALLSLDGLGDFGSGAMGVGEGHRLRVTHGAAFPHSLGLAYTAVTQFLGFPHYGDEYKVMGLAAYGVPRHLEALRALIGLGPDGLALRLDLRAFRHHRAGPGITWGAGAPRQAPLWGPGMVARLGAARTPDAPLDDRHRDVAASLQARTDEVVTALVARATAAAGSTALAYAGGVAYNCVANARALAAGAADALYIPPAPGDAGLALGAAWHVWHHELGHPRGPALAHAHWGDGADNDAIAAALAARGLAVAPCAPDEVVARTAAALAAGRIVGWFQGRMEFGPRALGGRSILADPRRAAMKDILNARVKRREGFRPFAPAVLAERAAEWFDLRGPSPFMLLAVPVRPGRAGEIPAVTHVDGTARLQTVTRDANPRFHALLTAFAAHTGVPVLLNTSFNENEPVVRTADQAIACFQRADIDLLAIGSYVVERAP